MKRMNLSNKSLLVVLVCAALSFFSVDAYIYRASVLCRTNAQGKPCYLWLFSDLHAKGTNKKQAEAIMRCAGSDANYIFESHKAHPCYQYYLEVVKKKAEEGITSIELPSVLKFLEEGVHTNVSYVDVRLPIFLSELGKLSIKKMTEFLEATKKRWLSYDDCEGLKEFYILEVNKIDTIINTAKTALDGFGKSGEGSFWSKKELEDADLDAIGLDIQEGSKFFGVEAEGLHSAWLNKDKEKVVMCLGGAHLQDLEAVFADVDFGYKKIKEIGVSEELAEKISSGYFHAACSVQQIPALTIEELGAIFQVEASVPASGAVVLPSSSSSSAQSALLSGHQASSSSRSSSSSSSTSSVAMPSSIMLLSSSSSSRSVPASGQQAFLSSSSSGSARDVTQPCGPKIVLKKSAQKRKRSDDVVEVADEK